MVGNVGTKFKLNDKVRIKADRRVGIITGVLPSKQYQVFLTAEENPVVYEDDLEPVDIEPRYVDGQDFLRELLLFKLRRPLSDTLYSWAASRTNLEKYQFKPAIKFVNNSDNRILIADEVGLGKTIEACIIYLELKARMQENLRRVLVVCPAGLTEKWRDELESRFNEDFAILDGNQLQTFFRKWEDRGASTFLKGICSLERLRRQELAEPIADLNVQFDLVIVDEAHHMRNPETLSFDLGEILSTHSDAMLLLTATPVQLRSLDLFYLLNILEPGEFERADTFEEQLEPNRYINRAILALDDHPPDVESALSQLERLPSYIHENPYYIEAIKSLQDVRQESNGKDVRARRIDAIRNLHKVNTFSYIFNRTRRAEVKVGAKRVANVVAVELTSLEREIYESCLEFARARAEHYQGYAHVLGLIQIERQIASSLGAFKSVVDEFRRGTRGSIETEEGGSDLDFPSVIRSGEVYEIAQQVAGLYQELGEKDTKFESFREELNRLFHDHSKVIVFSFFKRTLGYLARRLSQLGYTVRVIHGDVPMKLRHTILDRFKSEDEQQVLLSSEVGAEGQDFQFCDVIINYDLPWNPMRVEQRIGRIDRYGQESEKVMVASFFLQGTIEERILWRLYDRIGVFKESIGELEPIMGDIVKTLSQEAVTNRLSPEEEAELLERSLDTLEHRKRDLQEFEDNRYELIGQDKLFTQEIDANIESGRYVAPNEIKALCFSYLADSHPQCCFQLVEEATENWFFVPSKEFESGLRLFLSKRRFGSGGSDWEFLRRVEGIFKQGGPRGVPVTFDSEVAHARRPLEFVNVWHPLAKMAFEHFRSKGTLEPEQRMVRFVVPVGHNLDSGEYCFFLFSIASHGITESHQLHSVILDFQGNVHDQLSTGFLKVVQESLGQHDDDLEITLSVEKFHQLKANALEHMGKVRQERENLSLQRNNAQITARKASLERTFHAKVRRAEARLERAEEPRIIRMHQGEIRNLQTRLNAALEELEARRQVSVTYEPVAYGLVRYY